MEPSPAELVKRELVSREPGAPQRCGFIELAVLMKTKHRAVSFKPFVPTVDEAVALAGGAILATVENMVSHGGGIIKWTVVKSAATRKAPPVQKAQALVAPNATTACEAATGQVPKIVAIVIRELLSCGAGTPHSVTFAKLAGLLNKQNPGLSFKPMRDTMLAALTHSNGRFSGYIDFPAHPGAEVIHWSIGASHVATTEVAAGASRVTTAKSASSAGSVAAAPVDLLAAVLLSSRPGVAMRSAVGDIALQLSRLHPGVDFKPLRKNIDAALQCHKKRVKFVWHAVAADNFELHYTVLKIKDVLPSPVVASAKPAADASTDRPGLVAAILLLATPGVAQSVLIADFGQQLRKLHPAVEFKPLRDVIVTSLTRSAHLLDGHMAAMDEGQYMLKWTVRRVTRATPAATAIKPREASTDDPARLIADILLRAEPGVAMSSTVGAFGGTVCQLHPSVEFKPLRSVISTALKQNAKFLDGSMEALLEGQRSRDMLHWMVRVSTYAESAVTTPDDSSTDEEVTSSDNADDDHGEHGDVDDSTDVHQALQLFRTSRLASHVTDVFAGGTDSNLAAQAMLEMAPGMSDDEIADAGEFLSVAVAGGFVSVDVIGIAMVRAADRVCDVRATAEKALLSTIEAVPLPRQVAGLNALAATLRSAALHRVVNLGSRCLVDIVCNGRRGPISPADADVNTCATFFDDPFPQAD
jgi:hypothetical protein